MLLALRFISGLRRRQRRETKGDSQSLEAEESMYSVGPYSVSPYLRTRPAQVAFYGLPAAGDRHEVSSAFIVVMGLID